MRFTDEELANIASWTPISHGYDREKTTVMSYIRPILDRLSADSRLSLRGLEDGGMSNYFAFLVFDPALRQPPGTETQSVPCVVVQLSLMSPVAIYGQSTFSESESLFGWSILEPEQVCDPDLPPDWIAAAVVAAVHDASPYQLVGREVTDQLLPPNIEIYEYCLNAEPWNRVLHALFANTD